MRCSCPYLGVEQAGNTLSTSLLLIKMFCRVEGRNCIALMDVTVFSGSKPRPLHVFLFMNKSPGSFREWTKNTLAGLASVTSPHFSPGPCCGMWFYVYLFSLSILCMSTTANTLGNTRVRTCSLSHSLTHARAVPDPQQAISLTSRATAVPKTGYENVS